MKLLSGIGFIGSLVLSLGTAWYNSFFSDADATGYILPIIFLFLSVIFLYDFIKRDSP